MLGYFDDAQKILDADSHGAEVWLSGNKFAEKDDNILKVGFVLVLACMDTSFRYTSEKINHLRFPIQQTTDCDIKAYFVPSFEVIQAARKSGKVLIYSNLGINRSTTILISYIMQKYNKKWKQACQLVKNRRPCSQPCQQFLTQLQWFQKFYLNRL